MAERENLTRYRKGKTPVTDARDATEGAIRKGVKSGEFRVHIIRDDHVQETVFVVAPKNLERAEEVAIAARVKHTGPVDRCLVEYLTECASGCGRKMASYDPRYSKGDGAPTVKDVLEGERWCGPCGSKRHLERIGA